MSDKRLKVLLIHPEISRTRYNFTGVIENECLELEYISAILKCAASDDGSGLEFDIKIYDGQISGPMDSSVVADYDPDVVYVCGRARQENFMLEYCKIAKDHRKNILTIIGGQHASICYTRLYKPQVDYIITTFDYYRILDVIDHYFGRGGIASKDGVCYKSADAKTESYKWVHNQALPADISKLPRPDRSFFYEHLDNYRYLELEHAAWVRTAYSCPYHCRFCIRNRMNQGEYSCRDIVDVVDEIEEIDSENIYIVDDDFLFDNNRLETFVSEIKKRGIKKNYICYGRADYIASNPAMMKKLKSIGLYYVLVGLEAISGDRLGVYDKMTTVSDNVKSIRICDKLGINMMGMFIVDLDYTVKDFKNLYKWICHFDLKHVAISIYTPELCTEHYEEFRDRIITDNPSHFDYLHLVAKPTYLSVRRYYTNYYLLLVKLFRRAQKDGIYDFLDYKSYINSFIENIFKNKRKNDDE